MLVEGMKKSASVPGGIPGYGRERRWIIVQKLRGEEVEGCGVVHVVPERENRYFDAGGLRGGDGFGEDSGGAPGDVEEWFGVGALQTNEVVAAVMRGAENDAIAGFREFGNCLVEGCSGNCRRV